MDVKPDLISYRAQLPVQLDISPEGSCGFCWRENCTVLSCPDLTFLQANEDRIDQGYHSRKNRINRWLRSHNV